MTAFATSSQPLWKSITSNALTLLTVAWTDIHLYLCCACNAERSLMKASRRRLKTFQLESGAGGWTQQQELQREREREKKRDRVSRKSFFFFFLLHGNDFEAVKAHSEETAWTYSLGVFVGEIRAVSNEFLITEKGTHYHFCILSPFHSSSGFVSTKSAKADFCVAQFSSLVNQSGVAYVLLERRNCWKLKS